MGPPKKAEGDNTMLTRSQSTSATDSTALSAAQDLNRATRVLRLPSDVRLVSLSGQPVSQIAIPSMDTSTDTTTTTQNVNVVQEDAQMGAPPAKKRAPSTATSGDDALPSGDSGYGLPGPVPAEVDSASLRSFMVATSSRLEALTSNMMGFKRWMTSMAPLLHNVAASASPSMVTQGPNLNFGTVPTSTATSSQDSGKHVPPSNPQSTCSTYMAQQPIPSLFAQPQGISHNFINTDYSSLNNNLMQSLFQNMERRVHSAGLPLGFAVDVKIKETIWMNRFVEFQDLLAAQGESEFQVVHEALELDPNLGVILKKTKKQIKSLKHWEKAFMVYVAIYTQRPDLKAHLPQLFSYWWEVKAMADEGIDFVLYDELFRRERAAMAQIGASPWDWGIFWQDLYNKSCRSVRSSAAQLYRSGNNHNNFRSTPTTPRGYCFDYHAPDRRCEKAKCTFKHECPCGRGGHTLYTCKTSGRPSRKRAQAESNKSTNSN